MAVKKCCFGYDWLSRRLERICARYTFLSAGCYGHSALGLSLPYVRIGTGDISLLYSAAHHANEWITTPLMVKFLERLALGYARGGSAGGIPARGLLERVSIYIIPMVNPDGVNLLVSPNSIPRDALANAKEISRGFPEIPFPSGWKANISGVDLNLQYPAGWETAREIKAARGFNRPAPRDFPGCAPLTEPESIALYNFTQRISPALILAYHTQGETIYWKYLDREPPCSRVVAAALGAVSGYMVEETPSQSGYAGYKDWFIDSFNRPGYTVEAGLGESPLPISQLGKICRNNFPLMAMAATLSTALPQRECTGDSELRRLP